MFLTILMMDLCNLVTDTSDLIWMPTIIHNCLFYGKEKKLTKSELYL